MRFQRAEGFPIPFEISAGCCGDLLVGAEQGGVLHYSIATGRIVEAAGIPKNAMVNEFASDNRNRKLAATTEGLFREESRGKWVALVPGVRLVGLSSGPDGLIWTTAGKSILVWHEGVASKVATADGIEAKELGPIHAAADGVVWVGIRNQPALAAYRFKAGRLERISTDELPALDGQGSPVFIFDDPQRSVWTGGTGGIHMLAGKRWRHFGIEQGLPADLVFDARRQPDGMIVFSTGAGLVIFDPPGERLPNDPPPVIIQEASSRVGPLELSGAPRIAPGENDLSVMFSVLSTDLYSPAQVRYRLRPKDAWKLAPRGHRLEFLNLQPGAYKLELAARGRGGDWHNQSASFAFSVAGPFWRSGWFLLLCLLFMVAAMVAAQRWYDMRQRQLSLFRLQTMIDRYPGGVIMLGQDSRIQHVNTYVERVIGKSKAAMLGQMPEVAFGPVAANILAGVSGHGAISRVAFSNPADKPPLFYDICSFQLEGTDRGGQGICYFATDVTEQAKAEAARDTYRKELEDAHERYRSLVNNSTEAIWRLEFNPPIPMSLPMNEFIDACYERAIVAEANDNAAKESKQRGAELAGRLYRDIRDKNHPVNLESDRAWYRSGCQLQDYMTVSKGSDGRVLTFMTNIHSVIENGCLVRSWGIQREVTEKQRLQEMIVSTARAVSAHTGKAFFESLVEHLATTLQADCAYVAEAAGDGSRTLALWSEGRLQQPGGYSIEGTPSQQVLQSGRPCIVASDAAAAFPEGPALSQANIQAYAGTPLLDGNGATVGLVVVLFKRKLEQPQLVQSTLDIFAARASAEIHRLGVEAELRRHERQLRALAARNQSLVEQERTHLAREIHDELGQQVRPSRSASAESGNVFSASLRNPRPLWTI